MHLWGRSASRSKSTSANCHSWPLDVSSISQSQFIYEVWCSSLQGMYSWFPGGSIGQSRFVCQVWCTSIKSIYSQFLVGSICQSRFICQFWCTGIQGISALFPWGLHLPRLALRNNITYYTWHIWALILEICNCHFGGVLEVFWGHWRGYIWNDCTMLTELFTTLIIQK